MAHSAASWAAKFGNDGVAARQLSFDAGEEKKGGGSNRATPASAGVYRRYFDTPSPVHLAGAGSTGLTPTFKRVQVRATTPSDDGDLSFASLSSPSSESVRSMVLSSPSSPFQRNTLPYERQALKMARFANCYSLNNKPSQAKLVVKYLREAGAPTPSVAKETFIKALYVELSNFVNLGEDSRNELVLKFVKKAIELKEIGELPKRFSDAFLDLVESNELFLLTSLLYSYIKEKEPDDTEFPRSLLLDKPTGESCPWLYCQDEAEMVKLLLENPDIREQMDLGILFDDMLSNPYVSDDVLDLAITHFLSHIKYSRNAPNLCHIDKIEDLQLGRALVLNPQFTARARRYPKFNLIKNEMNQMHVWDPSHLFEPALKGGKPTGYHVLQTPDVHFQEKHNATILPRDPMIQEGPMMMFFYEMQYTNEAGEFCKENKLSSWYLEMDEEALASSIFTILSQPLNNPLEMRRANEIVYYGFHMNKLGQKVLSQLYVNVVDDVPHVKTCYPVPFRQIQEKQLAVAPPQSPPPKPRVVRRSPGGLLPGSPLKREHNSPSKRVREEVKKSLSPWKNKSIPRHPVRRIGALKDKVVRLLERLDTVPSNDPDLALIKVRYSSIRDMRSTRDLILSAASQVHSPKVKNQQINIIKPDEAPAGYSDVETIVCVPISELIEIANEALA